MERRNYIKYLLTSHGVHISQNQIKEAAGQYAREYKVITENLYEYLFLNTESFIQYLQANPELLEERKRHIPFPAGTVFYGRKNFGKKAGRARRRLIFPIPCYYCQKTILSLDDHSFDHKTPICRGGSNDWSNIENACKECNLKKGNLTEEGFRGMHPYITKG
jgi:hypothetical protein